MVKGPTFSRQNEHANTFKCRFLWSIFSWTYQSKRFDRGFLATFCFNLNEKFIYLLIDPRPFNQSLSIDCLSSVANYQFESLSHLFILSSCVYNNSSINPANTISSRQQPSHLKASQAEGGDGDTNYTHVSQWNTKTSTTFTLPPPLFPLLV